MRAEQQVDAALPADLARAAVLATSLRAPVLAAQTAIVAGFVLLFASFAEVWVVVVVAAALVAFLVAQRPLAVRRLERTLPSRGYRPGSTLTLDWSPESFTFRTERGVATHRHDEVAWRRDHARVTVLFVAEAKIVVLLPTALVTAAAGGPAAGVAVGPPPTTGGG